MNKQLNDIYHSANIVDTLVRHGLHEKTAHEIADILLQNPKSITFSKHDQQRIEFLDSLTESENKNAWKEYLNSRSGQVIDADKRALEKYLYATIQRLSTTTKKIQKHEGYFKNTITDIGSIIWSKQTLDFINDWQQKNPNGGDNQYSYSPLSFMRGSSVPGSFYNN